MKIDRMTKALAEGTFFIITFEANDPNGGFDAALWRLDTGSEITLMINERYELEMEDGYSSEDWVADAQFSVPDDDAQARLTALLAMDEITFVQVGAELLNEAREARAHAH